MPSISLTLPVAGTVITAGLHASNYTALQTLLNGGLDTANWASGKIFAPSKLMQESAAQGQTMYWNGTIWVPVGGMVKLFDSTLGVDTASFDITSIDQNFAHLKLVLYTRGDLAAAAAGLNIRFNNDSGANYDIQHVEGTAAAATTSEVFAQTSAFVGTMPANSAGANLFGAAEMIVPFYAGTVNNKALTSSWSHKSGTATGNLQTGITAGFWRSNAAITRVTILPSSGNLKAGSRCTLYGLSV